MTAPVNSWLCEPLDDDVRKAVRRISLLNDARYIAIMPDVHLAHGVPIGTVIATQNVVYPEAVGGDIGCGMTALRFEMSPDAMREHQATAILTALADRIPINKHRGSRAPNAIPSDLRQDSLSSPTLDRMKNRDGRVQLGTLGRGNHFVELQRDRQDGLWVTIHSGSRAMGQAIMKHHLDSGAVVMSKGLRGLDVRDTGADYLHDAAWATRYASANRLQMLFAVCETLADVCGAEPDDDSLIDTHHNHVRREQHLGSALLVHRKGASPAALDEWGIIPGSMGTESFHVQGRGCARALDSSSHGAGRRMSRSEARTTVRASDLARSMSGVWFDTRKTKGLREEAPEAYKDIHRVMRAQRELVRIKRVLSPLLNFKGGRSN